MAPSWLLTQVQTAILEDETGYMQFGFGQTTEYFTYSKNFPESSAWIDHPSKNATGLYKFVGIEVNLNQQKLIMTRQTYDFLTYLGDIGGLTDALHLLGKFLISPFSSFSLQSVLLGSLFRLLPSHPHK